ncbi:MAG: hypothetical protein WA959_32030 [Rivularia sp. (in: cyanobacteria)]
MKTQALNIRPGDRIIAYFKNKMQICTVRCISNPDLSNITLLVFLGDRYRHSSSGTIRFKPEALVELIEKYKAQKDPGLIAESVANAT